MGGFRCYEQVSPRWSVRSHAINNSNSPCNPAQTGERISVHVRGIGELRRAEQSASSQVADSRTTRTADERRRRGRSRCSTGSANCLLEIARPVMAPVPQRSRWRADYEGSERTAKTIRLPMLMD